MCSTYTSTRCKSALHHIPTLTLCIKPTRRTSRPSWERRFVSCLRQEEAKQKNLCTSLARMANTQQHKSRFMKLTLHCGCCSQVRKGMDTIFETCISFTELVQRHDDLLKIPEMNFKEVEKNFETQSNFLFRMLSGVKNRSLNQLLLRIDFNKYFSRSLYTSMKAAELA
eukprot:m.69385 g.69385  ORF g.69385 m.69385 type:complete len:169 (-) comp16779_c0_seq2:22-528(-)